MGTGPLDILLIVLGLLIAVGLLFRPEIGSLILVILIFTRVSDVLVQIHELQSIAKLFFPLMTLIILIRWAVLGKRPENWERTILLLGGYAVIGILSLLYAEYPDRVQSALITFAKDSLILIILVVLLKTGTNLKQVIWALLAAGIFLGAISTYQFLTSSFGNNFWGFGQASKAAIVSGLKSGYRVGGPGLGFNAYGRYMILIVPLAFDRIINEKKIVLRVLASFALAVSVLTIFFTFSRGTLIGLIVLTIYYVIRWKPSFTSSMLVVLIALLAIQFLPTNYTERLLELRDLLPTSSEFDAESNLSFRGRISENTVAWQMFLDYPLFGVGLSNYEPLYQSYSVDLGLDPRSEERSPHSIYLEILAEMGLFGFVWFIALQWLTFSGLIKAGRKFRIAGMLNYAGISLAIEVAIIGFLVTGLFLHNSHARFFWMLYGLALTIPNVVKYELASNHEKYIEL